MKKLLLFFLFANICIFEYAQGVVSFELKSDATFKTSDGQSYVVIPFEGKTAQELYNLVKSNVMKTYNSPKDEIAKQQLQTAFPDREIVGIDCTALIKQHGSLHCVTMQY